MYGSLMSVSVLGVQFESSNEIEINISDESDHWPFNFAKNNGNVVQ